MDNKISPEALPNSLQYDLLPTLPESAFSYDVSVSPDGQNSLTVPISGTAFYSTTAPATFQFANQDFVFSIPCGMNEAVYLDPKETTLSGRLAIVVSTALVAGTGTLIKARIISSFASFFDTLRMNCNNSPYEIVGDFGNIYNQLLLSTINTSERQGGLSINMGCDPSYTSGLDIQSLFTATGTYYFNWSIPLICSIGLNTSTVSSKLIPIGSINNLQLTMTTASNLPIATSITTGNPTTQPVFSVGLDQLTLNMKYLNIGDIGRSIMRASLYEGKYYIKSQTYTVSTATIPSNSAGQVQLSFQIRQASVKSLLWRFSISKGLTCPNGYYDAFNPALTSVQVSVGGVKYPNKPLNPSLKPAETFTAYQQAFGGSSLKSFGGVLSRVNYNTILPSAPASADNSAMIPASYLRSGINIVDYPNTHFEGLDLEKTNGNLMTGINTKQQPPVLEMTLGVASTSTITTTMIGIVDFVLMIDPITKTIVNVN